MVIFVCIYWLSFCIGIEGYVCICLYFFNGLMGSS